MRLLSIHWGLSFGGVAKYAVALERVRECIPVQLRTVCVLPEDRAVDLSALEALDATVVRVRSVADLSWISRVRKIITEQAPDCVMSHGFNGHLVSLLCAGGRGMNISRLATYHGGYHAPTPARRLIKPVFNAFTHWFLRYKSIAVLSVAQYCVEFLIQHGVAADKIAVVHNGIEDYQADPEARDIIRREWGFLHEHTVIGVASRLDPIKGLEYLLIAFAKIYRHNTAVRLVLMGDGPVRQSLEEQAKALGIESLVVFTGMRDDISRCLTALDIFALPSLAEHHSIGLLEAMRAGLATVATDVGGNTESLRHEHEGLIVPPADAESLTIALNRLINDVDSRHRFGEASRERFLAEFTEEAMLRKTAHWLQKVCCK
jgi:glycosyltransferase involved in cell wall biosynthesis